MEEAQAEHEYCCEVQHADREQRVEGRPKALRLTRFQHTRWNSVFNCIGRALRLKTAVDTFLFVLNNDKDTSGRKESEYEIVGGEEHPIILNTVTPDGRRTGSISRQERKMRTSKFNVETQDWVLFHQLHQVLDPIRKMSVRLESDKDVTISDVALFIHRLLYQRLAVDKVRHMKEGLSFVARWRSKFLSLVDDVEQMYLWVYSAALDGRRKDLESWLEVFYDSLQHADDFPKCHRRWGKFKHLRAEVEEELVKQIRALEPASAMLPRRDVACGPSRNSEQTTLWDDFLDAPVLTPRGKGSKDLDVVEREVRDYFAFEWRDTVPNPNTIGALEWWKMHEAKFPRVANIARRRLSTQASSACSERSFSKAGLILRKHRLSLSTESVDGLSLLGWHVAEEARKEASQMAKAKMQETIVQK